MSEPKSIKKQVHTRLVAQRVWGVQNQIDCRVFNLVRFRHGVQNIQNLGLSQIQDQVMIQVLEEINDQ